MGSEMFFAQSKTKKQFEGDVVKLRSKPQVSPLQNNKSRASKVTSMIELFSGEKGVDFASIKPKPCVRNSTIFANEKELQEVVDCDKTFGHNNAVTSPKSPSRTNVVSVGIRVPKPFLKEGTSVRVPKQFLKEETHSNERAKEQNTTRTILSNNSNNQKTAETNTKVIGNNAANFSEQNFQGSNKNEFSTGKVSSNQNKKPAIDSNGIVQSSNRNSNITASENKNFRQKSPDLLRTANSGARSLFLNMDKREERRITNARNYWEHKLEPRRNFTTRGLTPYKSESNLNSTSPSFNGKTFSPISSSKTDSISGEMDSPPQLGPKYTFPNSNSLRPSSPNKPTGISPPSPSLKPKNRLQISPPQNEEKPVVPSRPRFMTTASGLRIPSNPFPNNRPVSEIPKVSSSLYSVPQKHKPTPVGAKLKIGEFPNRPVSPLAVKTPPPSPKSPKETKTRSEENFGLVGAKTAFFNGKIMNKKDTNNNTGVNPLPKPHRTFTFGAADASPRPVRPPRPLHRNLIRVSSDLTTIKGDGIQGNLETAFLNPGLYQSNPDLSSISRAPKEGYEEVTFFKPNVGQQQQMSEDNRMTKWNRQHNYEEVEDLTLMSNANGSLPHSGNYDRIDLQKPARPLSLSDLDSNYSHLTFRQNLQKPREKSHTIDTIVVKWVRKWQMFTKKTKPSALAATPHTKLSKQNSDMSEILLRTNSISKSERSMESGVKLQITDKIREAFSQISRKYKHHWKYNLEETGSDGDVKSLSSSGDEDSDTEMDMSRHRQTLDRTRTMQKTYRSTLKYKSLERELSGSDASTVFEQVLICKVVPDPTGKISSKVSYRFPAPPPGKTVGDEKTLAHFCFPDIGEIQPCREMMSHSYSFMLTREDGTRKFGYCRRILPPGNEPRYPVVYCLISAMGSFGLYETILDELERRHRVSLKKVSVFIESLFVERFPAPGRNVRVEIEEPDGRAYFVLRRPFDTRLEHVDLQCLLSELGVDITIKIFASLLLERRVIISGKSLSTLTACIHAFRALLYPFIWQHVFVPVLPQPMVDLCCSPTPLLIGILETSLHKLRTLPLEEVFLVNMSTQEVLSSAGDEMEILPRKLQTPLINSLTNFANNFQSGGMEPSYDFAIDYESAERNTVISESFMHLFVEMIGHYPSHFQTDVQSNTQQQTRWGKIQRTFNRISFYEDVTSRSLRRFLDLFMGTQMFDGFIHSRELANTDYEGLFERRIARHLLTADASNLNFKVFRTKMKRFMQGIGKKKI
uniref:DENN domain-containing protein 2C-like isoform X1 n=1 Tax=Styela clava TaxID=7725 RepID=UPI00193AB7A4|nr:DENN domain-containing protein 2C-like isoform X1 [Styela clava]